MPVEQKNNGFGDAKLATQNNLSRRVVDTSSTLLNTLVELGFGYTKAILAITNCQNPIQSFIDGITITADEATALGEYSFIEMIKSLVNNKLPFSRIGAWATLAMDGVDGLRAKHPEGGLLYKAYSRIAGINEQLNVNPLGQLVDVGADRRREYEALKLINPEDEEVAKSVGLPSLMRALAEGLGFFVPESKLDRRVVDLLTNGKGAYYNAGTSLGRNKLIIEAAYQVGKWQDVSGILSKILSANCNTAQLRADPKIWRKLPISNDTNKVMQEGVQRFIFLVWQMSQLSQTDWLSWAENKVPDLSTILNADDNYLRSLLENIRNISNREDLFAHLNNLQIDNNRINSIAEELKPRKNISGKTVWSYDLDGSMVWGSHSVGQLNKLWIEGLKQPISESRIDNQIKLAQQQIGEFEENTSNTHVTDKTLPLKGNVLYKPQKIPNGAISLMHRVSRLPNTYQVISSGVPPKSVAFVNQLIEKIYPYLDEDFKAKPEGSSSLAWKMMKIENMLNSGAVKINHIENDLVLALALAKHFDDKIIIHLRSNALETHPHITNSLIGEGLPENIKLFSDFADIVVDENKQQPPLLELLQNFDPEGNDLLRYFNAQVVIGYGSAFHKQTGYDNNSNPMFDLIIGVKDLEQWYRLHWDKFAKMLQTIFTNMPRRNGPKYLAKLGGTGAKINYHHGVINVATNGGARYKIGVVSTNNLIEDLKEFTAGGYVAGRLQKPVYMQVKPSVKEQVEEAMQKNLYSAVIMALILMPERFTLKQLMLQITSLSYIGDSRQKLGIDRGKANKIYNNNTKLNFSRIYEDVIKEVFSRFNIKNVGDKHHTYQKISQNVVEMFLDLPINLQKQPINVARLNFNKPSGEFLRDVLIQLLTQMNTSYSTNQTLKGLKTTGVTNSLRYILAKFKKAAKIRREH